MKSFFAIRNMKFARIINRKISKDSRKKCFHKLSLLFKLLLILKRLDDFYKRMEIPNPKSLFLYAGIIILKKFFKDRWDSPLFEVRDTEPTPLKEIAQVILFEEKKAKDPISTKSVLFFSGETY